MRTRVISGIVIAIILVGVWAMIFTPVFDIFFAILAGAACFEVTRAAGVKNTEMKVVAIIFSAVLLLGMVYPAKFPIGILCMIYVMFLIILTIINNSEITFEHLTVTIYSSFVIPIAFSTISLIADFYQTYDFINKPETVFFIWYAVCCALFTDVFAFQFGVKYGKHKMAPVLSPKKSWEGAIAGVVCVILLNAASLAVFLNFFATKEFALPIWLYLLMSPIFSVCGIFGDLAASFIKRNYGVKDYSNLIPGHGGIMDRFDSVILVMPAFYVFITIYGMVVGA